MKPERALELVQNYAKLTKEINGFKKRISAHLDKCEGISGRRLGTLDESNFIFTEDPTHLSEWYTRYEEREYYHCHIWYGIEEADTDICPHCKAAHEVIQERKEAKRELGAIKRTMSRWGGA